LHSETFQRGQINVSKSKTVEHTVKHLEQTDSIKNHAKSDRPATATSNDKALDVLLSFVEDPHNFICDVAQQHNIGSTSVHIKC